MTLLKAVLKALSDS